MPDPVTTGALVVAVLAKVADTGVGELTKHVVKDAYDKLKEKVTQWAGNKVEILEAAPDSVKTQDSIAAIIDEQSEDDRSALRLLAQNLIDGLKTSDSTLGVDFSDLKNVEIALKKISVKGEGIGARVRRMEGGKIQAGEIAIEGRQSK
jgi:hypothetical protein